MCIVESYEESSVGVSIIIFDGNEADIALFNHIAECQVVIVISVIFPNTLNTWRNRRVFNVFFCK